MFIKLTNNSPIPSSSVADPHFKTFNGHFFSYHGECDLVLMRSVQHDIAIHIRTTRVDHPRISYSYISNAAVQVGQDVLEVLEDGKLLINGDSFASDHDSTTARFGQYELVKTKKGSKKNIISYELDLGNGRLISIRSNTNSGMLFVDVDGNFADSKGLLGKPGSAGDDMGLYSRDGSIDMRNNWNSYGEEWQTRSGDDPMLFQKARAPQYPVGCSYDSSSSNLRHSGRRRLMDATGMSEDVASKACANAVAGKKMEFCVADLMMTGDVDLAEDPFYLQ